MIGSGRSRAVHFGWVSLFQDLGSKMVVPVLPLFLVVSLGASPLVVGLVEGAGAVAAALAATVIGRRVADRAVWWVRVGYGLSSIAKLALAVASAWPTVLCIRIADRAGKGIRDAPRDLLLAETPADRRGRAFGIQQAMDKTGGVLGPLVGLVVFQAFDESFDAVFVMAFVPCAISVLLLWAIPTAPEPRKEAPSAIPSGRRGTTETDDAAGSDTAATARQRRALVAVGLHSLGFVPISLLLLRALDVEASVTAVLLAFAALRAVTAVTSPIAGRLVDGIGPQPVVVGGMAIGAASIVLAALADTPVVVWSALVGVGLTEAATKAPVKAWLLTLGPVATAGPVLGDRSAIAGIATFASALAVGAAWGDDGRAALLVAGGVAAAGAVCAGSVRRVGHL
ncbi:MAG: MFS transporter [Actinomycetota bacterium]